MNRIKSPFRRPYWTAFLTPKPESNSYDVATCPTTNQDEPHIRIYTNLAHLADKTTTIRFGLHPVHPLIP